MGLWGFSISWKLEYVLECMEFHGDEYGIIHWDSDDNNEIVIGPL